MTKLNLNYLFGAFQRQLQQHVASSACSINVENLLLLLQLHYGSRHTLVSLDIFLSVTKSSFSVGLGYTSLAVYPGNNTSQL